MSVVGPKSVSRTSAVDPQRQARVSVAGLALHERHIAPVGCSEMNVRLSVCGVISSEIGGAPRTRRTRFASRTTAGRTRWRRLSFVRRRPVAVGYSGA
jgi:hypothetical protein